jgi:hypothetical protein
MHDIDIDDSEINNDFSDVPSQQTVGNSLPELVKPIIGEIIIDLGIVNVDIISGKSEAEGHFHLRWLSSLWAILFLSS